MARARILIVENDRFYIEFYREVLGKEGYTAEVARTRADALRRVSAEPFDLVIADVVLKGASGLEVLSEIKRQAPALDVIMITSMQSLRKAVEALKLGASDYLTKPVDKWELLLAVQKILDRQVVSQEQSRLISENIRFYELLRLEKKILSLMSILDLERLESAVLQTLMQELQAPGAALFVKDGDQGYRPSASRGSFERKETAAFLLPRTPSLGEALEAGRPLMESVSGEQWEPRGGDEGHGLILPLLSRGVTLGAVRLAPRAGDRAYGPVELNLARTILEGAGMAMANARRVKSLEDMEFRARTPGTYTPAYFRSFAQTQLAVSKRYNREAALIIIRMDNYRALTAMLKESQADEIVGGFCRAILEIIRETDVLSRLEDDLFAVFVPETDYYGALMLIKRLRSKLSRTVFPVDLKREALPVIRLGGSACPRDGDHYPGLLEAARGRLDEEERSVNRRLGLEGLDFWSAVGRLLQPAAAADLERAGPSLARRLRPITLTREGFISLAAALVRDLEIFCASRGLLYLGIGQVDPGSPIFADSAPAAGFKLSIFAMGARGEEKWNLPHVTPVFVGDPVLKQHLFALAMTESFSYALFCRQGDGERLEGFHSCDQLLVMDLISGLQDKYLLQRRIG